MRYPFNKYEIQNAWWSVKHAWQRAFRGFDDMAYWGLYAYLTDIALPVLKWYRSGKGMSFHPITDGINSRADWEAVLDKMIRAFELLHADEFEIGQTGESQWKEVDEGLQLFAKHFRSLWD